MKKLKIMLKQLNSLLLTKNYRWQSLILQCNCPKLRSTMSMLTSPNRYYTYSLAFSWPSALITKISGIFQLIDRHEKPLSCRGLWCFRLYIFDRFLMPLHMRRIDGLLERRHNITQKSVRKDETESGSDKYP